MSPSSSTFITHTKLESEPPPPGVMQIVYLNINRRILGFKIETNHDNPGGVRARKDYPPHEENQALTSTLAQK